MRRNLTFLFIILLFIASCKLIEDESSTITDPTGNGTSSVKVLSPNGGESLMEGSSFEIKWEATTTSKLRIQASFDNASTWILIADSLSNSGIFSWFPIPNNISNQCKIRVSTVDGSASDMSDQVFFVVKNSNESLRITSPVGNEEWESGSSKQITWFSSGIDSVRLEYTTNNGNTWNLIGVDKRNTGIYYWEPIPNTPSTLAKVRIKDAKDGVPSSESPNTFKILPEPVIRVISPNGGEIIDIGSSFRVEWISENIQNVSIAYTTDNGYSWTSIVNSTPSIGYYYWNPVPNVNSQLCKIRVADALDSEPKDFSNNTFTIKASASQTITIKVPNGGESWEAGTAQQITWYSSSGIDSVYLEYTTDNGNKWNYIGKDTKNTGIYFWEPIPNTPSTLAKVRVKDAKDGVPSDESDSPFNILPEPNITVVTPNGGERWQSGTNQTIEWISENIANVKIDYTTNNGQQWITIAASTPSTGFYYWQNIPSHNSNLCKVRVSDADDNQPTDVSDNVFTITNQLTKSISILIPSGGEEWQAGTTENITWTSVGISNVKIEFTSNNGLTWNTIESNNPNTGAYEWAVPNTASTQCKIKISDISDITVNAESKNTFTINPIQSITLIAPNGNERIVAGENYTIRWIATGIKNVKIEYTPNNAVITGNWYTIVSSTPAAPGSYTTSFTIPTSEYRVRISDADDGTPVAVSSGTFTVTPKPSIAVISPNGKEVINPGSSFRIEWISENIENVSISFTTNNGSTWTNIIASTPSIGYYYWNPIPDINSQLCKIRIANAVVGEPNDVSDEPFTIKSSSNQSITIKVPNGGESWEAGTAKQITWYNSSGIDSVYLEYTTDNGNKWNYIGKDTKNTGIYFWEPIPNTPSTLAKIRIKEAKNGIIFDESDSPFNILPEPVIKVLVPNGGESWLANTSQRIEWNSENIENVKIAYTTDNGARWNTIVESTPSIGFYVWSQIPNVNSQNCKIRIYDARDGEPNDVSDGVFRITNQVVKSIQILSPNGGEEWEAGTKQNITWNSTAVSNVKIELTTDKGTNWSVLADNVSGGAYEWNISESLNSTQCQIRLSDAADNTISDVSDGSFTIIPRKYIYVLEPTGPKTYKDSDPIEIVWESSGIKTVGIKYTWNNGIAIYPDIPAYTVLVDKIANQGRYVTSFTIPSDKYHVIVYNADEGSDGAPSARSIGNFTIEKTEPPSISVLSPNGGEEWLTSDPQKKFTFEIRWRSYNVEFVKIQYSLNGGATWNTIENSYQSNGLYNWIMPDNVAFRSDNAKIRISSANNPTLYDESDGYFSIHPQSKLLRWSFPLGGEYLSWRKVSETFTDTDTLITWHSAGVYNVDIEYSDDNGLTWNTIIQNYRSTGAYNWNLPAGPPSTIARLRIVDVSADAGTNPISDITPNVFNLGILPAGTILYFDNKDPVSKPGELREIKWAASREINEVSIEYSLDSGLKWYNIKNNVPSKPGLINTFKWQVPEVNSDKVLIRILNGNKAVRSTKFRIEK